MFPPSQGYLGNITQHTDDQWPLLLQTNHQLEKKYFVDIKSFDHIIFAQTQKFCVSEDPKTISETENPSDAFIASPNSTDVEA